MSQFPIRSGSGRGAGGRQKVVFFADYERCSSDDNAAGDFSTIDNQRTLAREYIDARIAAIREAGGQAEYAGSYSDTGKTGTNLNRSGYKRLETDAIAGIVTVVVVTYMSRLGRGTTYDIAANDLKKAGATVELVQEHFTPDVAGRVGKKFKNVLDELYPIQVSEWTKTKQAGMVAAGYWTGGVVPYGYRSEAVPGMVAVQLSGGKTKPPPKTLVIEETEAVVVRQAMDIFTLTRNIGDVLRLLRKSAPERTWTIEQARRILTNDTYRGVLRYGANVNPTAFPAIVNEQLWDAVQSALEAREAERQTSNDPTFNRPSVYAKDGKTDVLPYYLRGIVYCPHCGARMTPSGAHGATGKVGYYVCTRGGNRSRSDQRCPVTRVNAARLHDAVLSEIGRISAHPTRLDGFLREAVRALPSPSGLREEMALLQRNRREADKKLARLVGALKAGGGAGAATIAKEIGSIESQRDSLTQNIAELQERINQATARRPDTEALRALWTGFRANWDYLTEGERTEVMPLLVEKVTMETKEKGTLHLFLQSPPREGGNSLGFGCAEQRIFHVHVPATCSQAPRLLPSGTD